MSETRGGVSKRELNEGLITCAIASRYNEGEPEDWLEPMRSFLEAGTDVNHATRWGGTVYGLASDTLRPFLKERGARAEKVISGLGDFFRAVQAGDAGRVRQRAAPRRRRMVVVPTLRSRRRRDVNPRRSADFPPRLCPAV